MASLASHQVQEPRQHQAGGASAVGTACRTQVWPGTSNSSSSAGLAVWGGSVFGRAKLRVETTHNVKLIAQLKAAVHCNAPGTVRDNPVHVL